MKRLFSAIIVILLVFCLPMSALGDEWDGGLIYNGDFSVCSDDADMAAGWQVTVYDEALSDTFIVDDSLGRYAVVLQSYETNDVRVCQDVKVSADTTYLLSAEICTDSVEDGQGANLSIDNYSIDGTFCYTSPLLGDNDWTETELYIHTSKDQTVLRVALRLGGYGKTSSGLAGFRCVSLKESDYDGADIVYLADTYSKADSSDTGSTDLKTGGLYGIIAAFLIVAIAFVIAYRLIAVYGIKQTPDELKHSGRIVVILAATFIVRLVLSLVFYGHSTDINCFMAWGNAALNGGLSEFYTSGMFSDYPPGYMYVCAAMSWLSRLFGFSYGSDGMAFLFKLPATLADMVSAWLLWRLARQNGLPESMALVLAALVAFNPVVAFVSGAWGQIESLLVLGIALSFLLLQNDKPIAAGAVYGLAVLMKPQALMFGPILAISYLCAIRYGSKPLRRVLKTFVAVIASLLTILLLSLPFKGTQDPLWLVKKYFSTSTSYPYASIEAFNFPALLGDNWASVHDTVLGIPYTVWGPVMIGAGILFATVLHILSYKDHSVSGQQSGVVPLRAGSLYLSSACMLTVMFTFGYYMHERYLIPVLLLLLLAYVYEKDRRILIAFFALSSAAFLNATAAMFIVDHVQMRGALYDGITRVGGFLETVSCLYLIWICIDILLLGHSVQTPLRPAGLFNPPAVEKADSFPAKNQSCDTDIIRMETSAVERFLNRRDRIIMLILTAVYAACALFNLGSLSAPETYWETDTPGDSVVISFDGVEDVETCRVFGNIAENGTLLFVSDEGQEELYYQTYDNMFRWDEMGLSMQTARITVSLYSGAVKINELAFFDSEGNLLPARVVSSANDGNNILDEQDIVPQKASYFNGMYFDELYHARTAYEHLNNLTPYENSHPPLGKIIISIGIAIFGMNPFGWRIMGTLFGVAMIPLMYIFGKRLFKDSRYAFLAAALFAFDFMHFTQTRIATIDVYAVFFIILMYFFMYEYITMNFYTDGLKKTLVPLALCGVSFGLGLACKWISAYAGVGLAVLFFGSLLERWGEYASAMRFSKGTGSYGTVKTVLLRVLGHSNDRRASKKEISLVASFNRNVIMTLAWCCLFFLLVPFTVYFLSYIPYYRYEATQQGSYALSDAFSTFGRYQTFMFDYHSGLTATHPYQSSWWQWPFTLRPMWYYSGSDYANGTVSTLTASGNPAVWWISSIGAVVLLLLRMTGYMHKDRALRIFCVGALANYLPWVLVTRCTFIYHFFATVPFILLSAVYLLQSAEKRYPKAKAIKWVWLAVAIVLFVLLYPGLSGYTVSAGWAAFIKRLPGGGLMYGA